MTAAISRMTGSQAHDLIYPEYLSKLIPTDQDIMYQTMVQSPQAWVGAEDGEVLGVWGLVPPTFLSDRAYLWLYTTEHLQGNKFLFIRHSQCAMEKMLAEYPLIVGHAVVGEDKSIRWLRWLGAKFGEPQGKLIPFEIKAKHG